MSVQRTPQPDDPLCSMHATMQPLGFTLGRYMPCMCSATADSSRAASYCCHRLSWSCCATLATFWPPAGLPWPPWPTWLQACWWSWRTACWHVLSPLSLKLAWSGGGWGAACAGAGAVPCALLRLVAALAVMIDALCSLGLHAVFAAPSAASQHCRSAAAAIVTVSVRPSHFITPCWTLACV
jgi:hypothetical protein